MSAPLSESLRETVLLRAVARAASAFLQYESDENRAKLLAAVVELHDWRRDPDYDPAPTPARIAP